MQVDCADFLSTYQVWFSPSPEKFNTSTVQFVSSLNAAQETADGIHVFTKTCQSLMVRSCWLYHITVSTSIPCKHQVSRQAISPKQIIYKVIIIKFYFHRHLACCFDNRVTIQIWHVVMVLLCSVEDNDSSWCLEWMETLSLVYRHMMAMVSLTWAKRS